MPFSLLPAHIAPALTALPPAFFQKEGIRLVLLDFDNTVLPYTTNEPSYALISWLRHMKEASIDLCVVSNSHKPRARDFCRRYDLGCVCAANKPFGKGIQRALAKYPVAKEQVVFIGDQIFTDILGANLADIRSVLVKPIHNHNIWLKLRHLAEQPFIYLARKRRL